MLEVPVAHPATGPLERWADGLVNPGLRFEVLDAERAAESLVM